MESNTRFENTAKNSNYALKNFSNFQGCRIESNNKSIWIVYSFDSNVNADKFYQMRCLQVEGANNIKVQIYSQNKSKVYEYRFRA